MSRCRRGNLMYRSILHDSVMTYFISWIILWLIKVDTNRVVYKNRGREEFEYTLENFFELGLPETIHVTFKLWWTRLEMHEDPPSKETDDDCQYH